MIRLALLVFAVAAVAASSASAALSPQDYRKQANALCAKTGKSLNALPAPTTARAIPGYLGRGLALQRQFVKSFGALDPPAALRSLHAKAVSLKKQEIAGVEELLAKIEGGTDPQAAVAALSPRLGSITKAEAATSKTLGLPACAKLATS